MLLEHRQQAILTKAILSIAHSLWQITSDNALQIECLCESHGSRLTQRIVCRIIMRLWYDYNRQAIKESQPPIARSICFRQFEFASLSSPIKQLVNQMVHRHSPSSQISSAYKPNNYSSNSNRNLTWSKRVSGFSSSSVLLDSFSERKCTVQHPP